MGVPCERELTGPVLAISSRVCLLNFMAKRSDVTRSVELSGQPDGTPSESDRPSQSANPMFLIEDWERMRSLYGYSMSNRIKCTQLRGGSAWNRWFDSRGWQLASKARPTPSQWPV